MKFIALIVSTMLFSFSGFAKNLCSTVHSNSNVITQLAEMRLDLDLRKANGDYGPITQRLEVEFNRKIKELKQRIDHDIILDLIKQKIWSLQAEKNESDKNKSEQRQVQVEDINSLGMRLLKKDNVQYNSVKYTADGQYMIVAGNGNQTQGIVELYQYSSKGWELKDSISTNGIYRFKLADDNSSTFELILSGESLAKYKISGSTLEFVESKKINTLEEMAKFDKENTELITNEWTPYIFKISNGDFVQLKLGVLELQRENVNGMRYVVNQRGSYGKVDEAGISSDNNLIYLRTKNAVVLITVIENKIVELVSVITLLTPQHSENFNISSASFSKDSKHLTFTTANGLLVNIPLNKYNLEVIEGKGRTYYLVGDGKITETITHVK